MANYICDKAEINNVKPNDWVSNFILSEIFLKDPSEMRRIAMGPKGLGLKPKMAMGLRNKEAAYFKFLTAAQWKKLFKSKGWDKDKIESYMVALKRDDYSDSKKVTRPYQKRKKATTNPTPTPTPTPTPSLESNKTLSSESQNITATEFDFILAKAEQHEINARICFDILDGAKNCGIVQTV